MKKTAAPRDYVRVRDFPGKGDCFVCPADGFEPCLSCLKGTYQYDEHNYSTVSALGQNVDVELVADTAANQLPFLINGNFVFLPYSSDKIGLDFNLAGYALRKEDGAWVGLTDPATRAPIRLSRRDDEALFLYLTRSPPTFFHTDQPIRRTAYPADRASNRINRLKAALSGLRKG